MKKAVIISLAALAVIVLGGMFIFNRDATAPNSNSSSTNSQIANSGEDLKSFTAAEVAEHSSKEDCWTIIEGSVYDVTAFIARHPGGDEIVKACGVDATDLFRGAVAEGRAGGHSSVAESQLAELKIGELQE